MTFRHESPELWNGPNFAVWVKAKSDMRLFVSGFFERLVDWEALQTSFTSPLFADPLTSEVNPSLIKMLGGADEILIEFDFDDELSSKATLFRAHELLTEISRISNFSILGRLDLFNDLPNYSDISPTANKLPKLESYLDECELLDLATLAFPNRHESFEVAYCKRLARVLTTNSWTVVCWETPQEGDCLNWGNSRDSVQRWPHHAIPGFLLDTSTTLRLNEKPPGRVLIIHLLERLIKNELYFLNHLQTEIEQVEAHFLKFLHDDRKDSISPIAQTTVLNQSLKTVTHLDCYLRLARENSTRLRRRLGVSILRDELGKHSNILDNSLNASLDNLDCNLRARRSELRDSLHAVNTATEVAGLREYLNEQQRTERFRTFASGIAVAFSTGSLTFAVYGSNIRDLTPVDGKSLLLLGALSLTIVTIIYFGASLRTRLRSRFSQSSG